MHARYVNGITIRQLRDGGTDTVALSSRASARAHASGASAAPSRGSPTRSWPRLRVDADHHVVAYVEARPRPAGMARLVRDGGSAEIAFEVADEHQGWASDRCSHVSSRPTRAPRGSPSRRNGVRRQRAVVSLFTASPARSR
jgi:hypothetical protein